MTDLDRATTLRKNGLRRAAYLIGLGLGGALLLYQAGQGLAALSQRGEQQWEPVGLVAAGLLSFIGVGLQLLGWFSLSRGIGIHLNIRQALEGYFVSFLPRYIPGLVWGYLGRGEWLFQKYNVPYKLSSYGSTLEISASITSNVLTLAACLVFGALVAWPLWLIGPVWLVGLMASGWLMWRFRPVSADWSSSLSAWRSVGLGWIGAVIIFQLVWLCYGAAANMLGFALGWVGPTHFFAITAAFCLAWLVGFVFFFVPAGIGIREFVLAALLREFGVISTEEASLVTVISRLWIVLSEILWVLTGVLSRVIGKY
jgi:hypothetical protein